MDTDVDTDTVLLYILDNMEMEKREAILQGKLIVIASSFKVDRIAYFTKVAKLYFLMKLKIVGFVEDLPVKKIFS